LNILVITDTIPYPPISGGQIRVYNLLRRIAGQHQVWLAALLDKPDGAEGVSHMEEFCCGVEVAPVRRRHPLAHLPGLLRYALAGRPLELKFRYSEELARRIRRLVSTVSFDVVQIHHSEMALYLEALPPHVRCKRILMLHNVAFHQFGRIFRIERRPLRKLRAWLHSLGMRRWEPHYAERFDRCIVVSEADRQRLMAANPRVQVDVIPTGVDTQLLQPLPHHRTSPALLFIGKMSYAPCADAVLYFCREILPMIRRRVGNVEMWVVGTDPPPEVRRLDGEGVHVTGRVADVVPYYRRSSVCVVPLRAGGGTRLKIFEAMALGRPVVSTTLGCEGLDVVDGQHLLIADSPGQFAERTVRLLVDRALYQRIATDARQLVVDHYDWDAVAQQLMQIYAEVVA
jgi:sugar transferase (PEP-CTERM/EpsH1 system associated)